MYVENYFRNFTMFAETKTLNYEKTIINFINQYYANWL